MRLIRMLVPTEDLSSLADTLDEEGIDFVATDERDGEAAVVEFPLPVQAVDSVLDELRDAGIEEGQYTVIANAESARTDRFDELEARYIESAEETDSVAHEEVRSKARSLLPDRRTYYVMTVLSVLVATAGILLDSPAVVIGSMAIAPQVGAAITASVGIVLCDEEMTRSGTRSLALGLAVAVVGAIAFGLVLYEFGIVPQALDVTTVEQISSRISPGFLSVLLGLCAGAAAALGVATDLPLSLVGVAIAAAVVPAAAAVGVGVVWGLPLVALGAGTLLVINTAAILLAGTATLWALGYRPEGWTRGAVRPNRSVGGVGRSLLVVAVLLAVIAVPGVAIAQHITTENAVNAAVQGTLEGSEYRELSLVSVETSFTDLGLLDRPQEVTIRVNRPSDVPYPSLADDLAARIERRTGTPVAVSVEFIEQQESRPG